MANGYGWRRDLPDKRDLIHPASALAVLPGHVDLRPKMPAVYDQGQLGSCTANAIAAAMQFDRIRQNLPAFAPSRLMIYYLERAIENTINSDAGAEIRDGMKAVAKTGACDEKLWPYVISKFRSKPSAACYAAAKSDEAKVYARVPQTIDAVRGVLAGGDPIVFGFTVYQSFESAAVAKTGVVPMPSHREATLGGHAVMAVGYDDPSKELIVRNSWGRKWGDGGYFYMPYAYFSDPQLASDFWTLRTVG